MTFPAVTNPQRQAVFRFLTVMAAGHLLWEMAHVRLYTLWLTGSREDIVFAVLHCTVGDVMIATTSLAVALAVFGRSTWPARSFQGVAITTILLALAYTVFSEWLNIEVRQSWAYRPQMPVLPLVGTGLTPILQWIAVPSVAFLWMRSSTRTNQGIPK
jgi:hypothetical protein